MKIIRAVVLRTSQILEKNKITRYRLEKDAHIPHSTMEAIFAENNESLNVKILFKIIKGLGMTVQEFFECDLFDLDNLEIF